MKPAKLLLTCASLMLGCLHSFAGINLSYAANQLTVTFDADVSFAADVSGTISPSAVSLVLTNIYTNTSSSALANSVPTPTVDFIAASSSFQISTFLKDNTTKGDVLPTDLRLNYLFNQSISNGDTLTISAGTAISQTDFFSTIPEPDNVSSSMNLFLADNSGNRISDIVTVAVPEPSTIALIIGCFGLGLVLLRRRIS